MINYVASPTGQAFLASRKFIKVIMGPVGGGKSTVALMDLMARAVDQRVFKGVRRTKFGILRNTRDQLKATVKPVIDTWFGTMVDNRMGEWRLQDNTFEMKFKLPDGSIVHSEFCMLAADTPDDVRRLLSLELSAAWVEEAREIDPEVFSGLQGRVARFPSRAAGGVEYPGVICSTNPPPRGGFWHELISNPPENTEVFLQPAAILEDGSINPEAENLENLDPEYYPNLISGKTEDWINVYLKNQFGAGDMGQPIFKSSYIHSFHTAKKPLLAVPATINPLIIGMDNGLQAAAVVLQQDMRGRVNLLGEAYVPKDKTMSVEKFMDMILTPYLFNKFPHIKQSQMLLVVDPACFQRSQVDEKTIAMAAQARGYTVVKASTNNPEIRIGAVEGLLMRQIDGEAGFLIDAECSHISDALQWGYRYKKSKATGMSTTEAEKTHHSHIADALQYACLHYNVFGPGMGAAQPVKKREVRNVRYRYT
jgi:hypothetical protein